MNKNGEFIENDYRADIRALCESGVHGIYTTGSTGEWYAIDDKEFSWMVDVILEEIAKYPTLLEIGCGGLSTESTIKRVKIAVSANSKPDGLQVLLPPWQRLTDDEIVDFFKAVADAAEGIPLIHYNTSRAKRFLTEREYEKILKTTPTLIGSKFSSSDIGTVISVLRSGLPMNHFVGNESILVSATIWGSKGVHSEFSLCWPKACLKLFELCQKGNWDEAIKEQEKFIRFTLEGTMPLLNRNYSDAAWDKGRAEAVGFLRCKRYIRPPHHWMSENDIEHLRSVSKKYFQEWSK